MKKIFTLLFTTLFFTVVGFSQEASLTKKEKRKLIPKYIGIGYGINSSAFRDLATSPLFYYGTALQLSLSQLKIDDKREIEFGIFYDFGTYNTDFNDNTSNSNVKRIALSYSRLFRIELFKLKNFSTKIGFLFNGNGNLRNNESLGNDGVGIDIFTNLLGSVKITKDISSSTVEEKKFLFWKYTLSERKKNLNLRLDTGLINTSYRNGYIYSVAQSAILNEQTIFGYYSLKMFSGFRARSSLNYTHYLKNNNAIRFSYVWDAYSTGGDLKKFEMAHHILKFTFLFNANNR